MSTMPVETFGIEQLTINSVDMRCAAWVLLDLADLWDPRTVFENRPSPGIGGTNPLPGVQDELVVSLPFWLTGSVDWEGNPYTNVETGFRRNRLALNNNLLLPGADATLAATYTSPDPDETPIDFGIQVRGLTWEDRKPSQWTGRLELCLPEGAI